jgi:hypothetical protein
LRHQSYIPSSSRDTHTHTHTHVFASFFFFPLLVHAMSTSAAASAKHCHSLWSLYHHCAHCKVEIPKDAHVGCGDDKCPYVSAQFCSTCVEPHRQSTFHKKHLIDYTRDCINCRKSFQDYTATLTELTYRAHYCSYECRLVWTMLRVCEAPMCNNTFCLFQENWWFEDDHGCEGPVDRRFCGRSCFNTYNSTKKRVCLG